MGLLKGPPRLYGYGKIKNNRHWGTSSIKGAQQLEAERKLQGSEKLDLQQGSGWKFRSV
jgi:hypothetical protein